MEGVRIKKPEKKERIRRIANGIIFYWDLFSVRFAGGDRRKIITKMAYDLLFFILLDGCWIHYWTLSYDNN